MARLFHIKTFLSHLSHAQFLFLSHISLASSSPSVVIGSYPSPVTQSMLVISLSLLSLPLSVNAHCGGFLSLSHISLFRPVAARIRVSPLFVYDSKAPNNSMTSGFSSSFQVGYSSTLRMCKTLKVIVYPATQFYARGIHDCPQWMDSIFYKIIY